MTAAITPPEWLTVGAKVAVIQHSSGLNGAKLQTVERITATTVVVGGERYRLDTLRRSTSDYGPSYTVEDPKDPHAASILRRGVIERLTYRAEDALRKWRNARFDPDAATEVRDALAALAPYLTADTEGTGQ